MPQNTTPYKKMKSDGKCREQCANNKSCLSFDVEVSTFLSDVVTAHRFRSVYTEFIDSVWRDVLGTDDN